LYQGIYVSGNFHWIYYSPQKSTKSRNVNSLVQIQIKSKSQLEFVLRHAEESEFLDLVDFGGGAFSVEAFIAK